MPNEKSGLATLEEAVGVDEKEKGEELTDADGRDGVPASFFFGNPRMGLAAIDAADDPA